MHGDSGISSGKSFEAIISDFRALSTRFTGQTEIIEYGQSTSGRPLTMMKIMNRTISATSTGQQRPAVLISEGIHGNEYLNITDRLPEQFLAGQQANSGFQRFVAAGGVVFVVPILNPDGYEARQRENAQGQDLNRDWSIKAAGNNGFTQPETRLLAERIRQEAQAGNLAVKATMEYHCCIGGLIYPWAYT